MGPGDELVLEVAGLSRQRFEQAAALADLSVRWVGPDDESDAAAIAERAVTDEFKGAADPADARSKEEQ